VKKILSNIGNNQKSNPKDVIEIKKALKSLGLYKGDVNVPYIDAEMDKGIYAVQKSQKLKTDGLIKPGGETENIIFGLATKSPQIRCPNCGGFHGGSKGTYCPSCTTKL
jgi:hypothetical protein